MNIESARVTLELASRDHATEWLAYAIRNREHLAPWEPKRSADYFTLDAVREELDAATRLAEARQGFRFAIRVRADSSFVGIINVMNIVRGVLQAANLGYSIDRSCQGQGYATEAVHAALAFAFDYLNLHRIETSYQPHNAASARVLEKCGFEKEGYAPKRLFINGQWTDSVMVAVRNDLWRE